MGSAEQPAHASDRRQIALAIAGSADVFLTRDDGDLIRFAAELENTFGLQVVHPVDFVLELDDLQGRREYAPARLHGSRTSIRTIGANDPDRLAERFVRGDLGESKASLAQHLRRVLADAIGRGASEVVQSKDGQAIAIWGGHTHEQVVHVSLLRVLGRGARTLSRALVLRIVSYAAHVGAVGVCVKEALSQEVEDALSDLGFVSRKRGEWFKVCASGAFHAEELHALVTSAADRSSDWRVALQLVADQIAAGTTETATRSEVAAVERAIWPGRLRHASCRSFLVPIQPRWAQDLFDYGLASEDLFGAPESLIFNYENVFYRSSHSQIVTDPGRILWYVSTDPGGREVRAVRACSSVLETRVRSAKQLYRDFRRLGIYEWRDVLQAAKGNPHGQVMAIRFGPTEMLRHPVSRQRLNAIAQELRGKEYALRMPVEITSEEFAQIYSDGFLGPSGAVADDV